MVPRGRKKKKKVVSSRQGAREGAPSSPHAKETSADEVSGEEAVSGEEEPQEGDAADDEEELDVEVDAEPLDGDLLDDDGDEDDEGDSVASSLDERSGETPFKSIVKARPKGMMTTRSLVRFDPLTAYIQEIRRYPLLSREEEHDYAVKYKEEGDLTAARRLVTANLRLVVKIAHEYRRAHQNLLDLVQEGNVGLMQAVKKFDPYRGIKLSTYSAWWIRAYILKFVLNNWRLVKIGTTQAQRKLFFNLKKQKQQLERMGIKPVPKAVAEALDVSEKEVVEMEKRMGSPEISLAAPVGNQDSSTPRTYLDMLSDDDLQPDQEVEGSEFRELLRNKLEVFARKLKGRDAVIYRERLMADKPLTLKQIGDRYGVTKERARQLEKRLLGKLREYLTEEMGEAVEVALGIET